MVLPTDSYEVPELVSTVSSNLYHLVLRGVESHEEGLIDSELL